jgi:Zn-dependent M32 family carboxypeptidase
LGAISNWSRENIHRHGNVYEAPQLMEKMCGRKPQMNALVDYLHAKFC